MTLWQRFISWILSLFGITTMGTTAQQPVEIPTEPTVIEEQIKEETIEVGDYLEIESPVKDLQLRVIEVVDVTHVKVVAEINTPTEYLVYDKVETFVVTNGAIITLCITQGVQASLM